MTTETAVKERPILFSGPMVLAILDGRKTQTRRILKPQPVFDDGKWKKKLARRFGYTWREVETRSMTTGESAVRSASLDESLDLWACPYGGPGDRLWVKETWLRLEQTHWQNFSRPMKSLITDYGVPRINCCAYAAECTSEDSDRCRIELGYTKWTPSIHMPRWASRLSLEITGVRVERLHDISEADAMSEGVERNPEPCGFRNYAHNDRRIGFTFAKDSFRSLWDSINGDGSWDANPWVWVVEFKRVENAS